MGLMPMISCPYIFTIAAGELRIFCTSEILMVFFIMSLLLCSLMFWCFLGFIHVSSTQMFFYLSLGQPTLLSVPYTFSADIDGQSLKWCHSISISATWSQSGSDVLFRDKNSYYHCNKWSFVELILFLSQWEDFFTEESSGADKHSSYCQRPDLHLFQSFENIEEFRPALLASFPLLFPHRKYDTQLFLSSKSHLLSILKIKEWISKLVREAQFPLIIMF